MFVTHHLDWKLEMTAAIVQRDLSLYEKKTAEPVTPCRRYYLLKECRHLIHSTPRVLYSLFSLLCAISILEQLIFDISLIMLLIFSA